MNPGARGIAVFYKDKTEYTVAEGDSLVEIARRFNVTKEELFQANPHLVQLSGDGMPFFPADERISIPQNSAQPGSMQQVFHHNGGQA